MIAKIVFFVVALAGVQAGIIPAAYVANYATSYSANVVNHAIAAPYYAAAPYVAAPAPLLAAASAPLIAPAAAPVVASAPLIAPAAYSVHPY